MASQGVTDRQLAASVRFGRKITISSPEIDDSPLTGYVAGFDDETIFLAIPQYEDLSLRKILVHRDAYTTIELPDESTMKAEPYGIRTQLDQMITKFRERILEDYFPKRAR